jgi:LPS export ABC transporter protein LptC
MIDPMSTSFSFRLLLSVCACCFLSVGCRNEISEIKAITDPQQLPVQTSFNAEYRYSVKGKLRNKLHAAQLDQFDGEDPHLDASGGFVIVFFDSLQQENARLAAKKGVFLQEQNKLIASDSVVLSNIREEKLETEELIFLQDSDLIFTDQFVTISTQNGVFHGKGLRSNSTLTSFRILQPTGDLYVQPK